MGSWALLGLSIATLSTVIRYGLHFSIISNIALESSSYRAIHHAGTAHLWRTQWLGREGTLEAFFCFALAFCGMIPALCWRYMHSTEVEDSMLDVYDFVYEEVRRNGSSSKRHELTLIHEVFLCCGKHSPLGDTAAVEHKMCHPGTVWAARRKCQLNQQATLRITYSHSWSILLHSAFNCLPIFNNLDRKGKYTLRGRRNLKSLSQLNISGELKRWLPGVLCPRCKEAEPLLS
uniref:Tetraspanin 32 n=1 Tax=Pavo cristatus TaxID=9049 RepID=A0A8C9EYG5_PAVCR